MGRPLIGITVRSHASDPHRRIPFGYYIPAAHVHAVEAAGGAPFLLPHRPDLIEDLISRLDGLVLSGGADVDPAIYDQPPHPSTYGVDPERDSFEMELVRRVAGTGLPCLAICRGIQVMNVALGGNLLQHVSDHTVGQVVHQAATSTAPPPQHDVQVQSGSHLAKVLGSESLLVNSYHHQAVDKPAQGLRVVAWAPDGIIEGVELLDHPFALGVQWHPERLFRHQIAHFALFRDLVVSSQIK